jgi:hypothetical protein
VTTPNVSTRFVARWPQGMIGLRHTRIVKNARIYLATSDREVTKIGWGDLGLEQWHILHDIAGNGLVLVAFERRHGISPSSCGMPEAHETLDDLVPALALGLDRTTAVVLNYQESGRGTLGAVSLPAVPRDETRTWVLGRLADPMSWA